MRTLFENTGTGRDLAIVLLSGSYMEPEDFVREGFVDALRRRGLEAQVVMAGVRAAHFSDGSVVDRLRAHALAPLEAQGVRDIWIAGISIGALAALCHAARHEAQARRRVLLSPYPGTRDVLLEIEQAGGLGAWRPAIGAGGDLEREAWRWLRDGGGRRCVVDCYYGSEDRFVEGQRAIAATLDPARVHEVEGAHEWKDWRRMWNDFLERVDA